MNELYNQIIDMEFGIFKSLGKHFPSKQFNAKGKELLYSFLISSLKNVLSIY